MSDEEAKKLRDSLTLEDLQNLEKIIPRLNATIDRQDKEIKRLKAWVNDLQRGTTVNCVYCGHQYGPADTTPVSKADKLKRHIRQCPEHPLSQVLSHLRDLAENAEDLTTAKIIGQIWNIINSI